jgi:hypothetical protein
MVMLYLDIHINIIYAFFLPVTAMNGKPHLEQEQSQCAALEIRSIKFQIQNKFKTF